MMPVAVVRHYLFGEALVWSRHGAGPGPLSI